MGRSPCCDDQSGLKKGPWTPEEDEKLVSYIQNHGHINWRALPKLAGLNRCGKSCRLRWINYLRPDIKRGHFSEEEEQLITKLHSMLGNKWSRIAAHLPGRTDNEIKNYWNTHMRKKLLQMGVDPVTHKPRNDLNLFANLSQLLSIPQNLNPLINVLRLQEDATQLAKLQVLQNIFQMLSNTSPMPILQQNPNPLESQSFNQIERYLQGINENNTTKIMNPPNYEPETQARAQYEGQGASSSWTSYEGGMSHDNGDNLKSLYALTSDKLPELVSISPEGSTMNQIESATNSTLGSSQSPTTDIFESWEKLIDDGCSESFWNDLMG